MEDFKVLWFEDNFNDFEKIIKDIENHCLMSHRKFSFDHFDRYPEDFDVKMFEGIYSLALIDLNLENGQKGVQIIETLRTNGAYIDVLLYSNN